MPDISEILKLARPREHSVTICVAGDLAGEVDRLETQMREAGQWQPTSMADVDPRKELAERIQALQQQMREAEVTFTFKALGAKAWSDLVAQHPGKTRDEAFDADTLAPALVAASAVDPAMTAEQVADLFEQLNHGQREALLGAAWTVNSEATSVPFSLLASAIRASHTAEK